MARGKRHLMMQNMKRSVNWLDCIIGRLRYNQEIYYNRGLSDYVKYYEAVIAMVEEVRWHLNKLNELI